MGAVTFITIASHFDSKAEYEVASVLQLQCMHTDKDWMKTKALVHWRVTFWVEIFIPFNFMSLITCLKRLKKSWGDWAHKWNLSMTHQNLGYKWNLSMTHQNLGYGLAFSLETWWRAQKWAPYLSEVTGPLPPSGSRRWSPLRCWRLQAPLPPAGAWPPRDPICFTICSAYEPLKPHDFSSFRVYRLETAVGRLCLSSPQNRAIFFFFNMAIMVEGAGRLPWWSSG